MLDYWLQRASTWKCQEQHELKWDYYTGLVIVFFFSRLRFKARAKKTEILLGCSFICELSGLNAHFDDMESCTIPGLSTRLITPRLFRWTRLLYFVSPLLTSSICSILRFSLIIIPKLVFRVPLPNFLFGQPTRPKFIAWHSLHYC